MALLTGMTADGLEVPVQVQPDGKLVAEGLEGPAGPAGAAAAIGGTAALPGLHPPGDENTGLYSPNPNELSFSTDGVERLRINANGKTLIGSTTERADWFNGARSPDVVIERSSGPSTFALCQNNAGTGCGILAIAKTRGSVHGSVDIVQYGDALGKISFLGSNGAKLIESAQILAMVDGAPSASIVPSSLIFYTTTASDGVQRQSLVLRNDGTVGIPRISVYADNTTARAAGLMGGDIYRKADGTMMIAF